MRRTIIATTVVSLLLLAVGAASASAETVAPPAPWWGVSNSEQPTDLKPGAGKNEVQQVTVSATGGEFALVNLAEVIESGFTKGFAVFKWNATAGELQAGLEVVYGPGNVRVLKGQDNATGSEPYEIEFTNGRGSQNVSPILGIGIEITLFGGTKNLEGAVSALATTLVEGSPDGKLVVEAENLGNGPAHGETTPVTITDTLPKGLDRRRGRRRRGPQFDVCARAGQVRNSRRRQRSHV